MSSHSTPHRLLTASHRDKVRLAAAPLILVTAWLSAAGCAGPQVYVPFEQKTALSAAARWRTLDSVAKREHWNVVLADPERLTVVAYNNPTGASGLRDRIKVELFSDRTVVETRSEIEDQGRWQAGAGRCAGYTFAREKLLAARVNDSESAAPSPALPRKATELAAR